MWLSMLQRVSFLDRSVSRFRFPLADALRGCRAFLTNSLTALSYIPQSACSLQQFRAYFILPLDALLEYTGGKYRRHPKAGMERLVRPATREASPPRLAETKRCNAKFRLTCPSCTNVQEFPHAIHVQRRRLSMLASGV